MDPGCREEFKKGEKVRLACLKEGSFLRFTAIVHSPASRGRTPLVVQAISDLETVPQRTHKRAVCNVPVNCAGAAEPNSHGNPVNLKAKMENVSIGGLAMRADKAVDVGAVLKVRFYLPDRPTPLTAFGEVVRFEEIWGKNHFGQKLIALKWTSIPDNFLEMIAQFVETHEEVKAAG